MSKDTKAASTEPAPKPAEVQTSKNNAANAEAAKPREDTKENPLTDEEKKARELSAENEKFAQDRADKDLEANGTAAGALAAAEEEHGGPLDKDRAREVLDNTKARVAGEQDYRTNSKDPQIPEIIVPQGAPYPDGTVVMSRRGEGSQGKDV